MRQREQCDRAEGCTAIRQCECPKSCCTSVSDTDDPNEKNTYAVKSAEAVAAFELLGLSLACQTAPL